MTKKIVFIVNPISGTEKKEKIIRLIREMTPARFEVEIVKTKQPGHASEISNSLRQEAATIVAVGGDGTVNETASSLIQAVASLGVIPVGSGNGLARHLRIPLQPERAIRHIFRGQSRLMDAGLLDGNIHFFCTAGFGFDAQVSHKFAQMPTRGLSTYLKVSYSEFTKYKPKEYRITVDGKPIEGTFFNVTIANASQFGNNAYIAPQARTSDGKLDLVLVRKFPVIKSGFLAWRLFQKSLHKSNYVQIIKGSEFKIESSEPFPVHIDGDPVPKAYSEISCKVLPGGLQVII